jgi:hypothetical protein
MPSPIGMFYRFREEGIGLALLFFALLVLPSDYCRLHEDALMLFEYARNLATRGTITFGNSETPIEGATDFLWMLSIAAGYVAGVPEYYSVLILTAFSAWNLLQRMPSGRWRLWMLAVIITTPYLYSALQGFSTLVFSAVFCWCYDLSRRRDRWLFAAILLFCLIRPDGVIWAAPMVVRCLWLDAKDNRFWETSGRCLTQLVIPGVCYFLWRAWYFGELLPLSFVVKTTGSPDLGFFWKQSVFYSAFVVVPALVALCFAEKKRDLIFHWVLLFGLPCLFYWMVRLEQNIGNRFFAPMFFGSFLLLYREKQSRAAILFCVISVFVSANYTVSGLLTLISSGQNNLCLLAKRIAPLQGKAITSEPGNLGFYSGWSIDDSWGLNTPAFAHRLIQPSDLQSNRYDLMVSNCDFDLLTPEAVAMAPSMTKDWGNQCKVLFGFAHTHGYESFLVPLKFGKTPSRRFKEWVGIDSFRDRCQWYFWFAVSPTFSNARELKSILIEQGGLPLRGKYPQSGPAELCF